MREIRNYVVFITAPSEEEAAGIGRVLVEERLAACANITGRIRSIYRWQDAIEDEAECLMILKTSQANVTGQPRCSHCPGERITQLRRA